MFSLYSDDLFMDTVIYSNSTCGSILDTTTEKWIPFSFWDSGGIQICDDVCFQSYKEAYEYAISFYS